MGGEHWGILLHSVGAGLHYPGVILELHNEIKTGKWKARSICVSSLVREDMELVKEKERGGEVETVKERSGRVRRGEEERK